MELDRANKPILIYKIHDQHLKEQTAVRGSGNNYRVGDVGGVYPLELRAEVYCVRLNFTMSKLPIVLKEIWLEWPRRD